MALFFLNWRLLLGRKIRVTATFHSSSLPKIHIYCYMIVDGYSEQRDVWIAYFHYNNNKKREEGSVLNPKLAAAEPMTHIFVSVHKASLLCLGD